MLEIKGLTVDLEEEEKTILKGVDLTVEAGKVHAIMGPNGSGKSTLSYVLSGRDGYEVTGGTAELDGEDILEMEPEERAAEGLFLAFQYPVEIPGVGNMTFLRTALNAQRKARGEEEMRAKEFLQVIREKAKPLKLAADGVNALRDAGRGFLVITHYQRLLDHIKPDAVHIMSDGRMVKTGGPELALEVEQNGYADILSEVA